MDQVWYDKTIHDFVIIYKIEKEEKQSITPYPLTHLLLRYGIYCQQFWAEQLLKWFQWALLAYTAMDLISEIPLKVHRPQERWRSQFRSPLGSDLPLGHSSESVPSGDCQWG